MVINDLMFMTSISYHNYYIFFKGNQAKESKHVDKKHGFISIEMVLLLMIWVTMQVGQKLAWNGRPSREIK